MNRLLKVNNTMFSSISLSQINIYTKHNTQTFKPIEIVIFPKNILKNRKIYLLEKCHRF